MSRKKKRAWNKLDSNSHEILTDRDFEDLRENIPDIYKAITLLTAFESQLDEYEEDSWLKTYKKRVAALGGKLIRIQTAVDRFTNHNKEDTSFYDLVEIRELCEMVDRDSCTINLTEEQYNENFGYFSVFAVLPIAYSTELTVL